MLDEDVELDRGGRRVYDDVDLGWIRFIRRLRATGMPLERVAEYTHMVRHGDGTIQQRRAMLQEHRDTVSQAIDELEGARRRNRP